MTTAPGGGHERYPQSAQARFVWSSATTSIVIEHTDQLAIFGPAHCQAREGIGDNYISTLATTTIPQWNLVDSQ